MPVVKLLLIVEPHLGLANSWMPILTRLGTLRYSINVLVTCECRIKNVSTSSQIAQALDKAASQVYMVGALGVVRSFPSLKMAVERASRKRNVTTKAWHRFAHKIGLFDWLPYIGGPFSLPKDLLSSRAVLFDILGLRPVAAPALLKALPTVPWFSLPHGISPLTSGVPGRQMRTDIWRDFANLKVFVPSDLDRRAYKTWYGLTENQIRMTGIPRHDPSWASAQFATSKDLEEEQGRPFFVLISRAADQRVLKPALKVELLQELSTLAKALQMKIVVSRHPSEDDSKLFERAFQGARYGADWEFDSRSARSIARGSRFCVTFLSSVTVDMVADGIPVIQFLKIPPNSQEPQFLRDKAGRPITKYEKLALALPASNFEELLEGAQRVNKHRSEVVRIQTESYRKLYRGPAGTVEAIANEIEWATTNAFDSASRF